MPVRNLCPASQKRNRKKVYGFDIETADDNKTFLCASIYANEHDVRVFYTKQSLINEFSKSRYKESIICATNLAFDFFGSFYDTGVEGRFNILFRGSDLLFAKSFITPDGFSSRSNGHKRCSITFIDTMNYVKMSVEKMGRIIGIDKLKSPDFIGQVPKSNAEWDYLVKYNIRDSKISAEFVRFFIETVENLGATFKLTIASTAMSLFRNVYLKDTYYQPDETALLDQFEAYYGGRTEVFKRGKIENVNYYDINSLYPSVMHDCEYPDPNSMRITHLNKREYIDKYEGVSKVDIHCPDTVNVPLLPYRYDNKLYFPKGSFSGTYTHIELREAMKRGYVLKKVYKTYYYKKTCTPFVDYTHDIYNKRRQYIDDKNPAQLITKLFLNAIYGKFGQKFKGRESWIHKDNVTYDMIQKMTMPERVGDYFRVINDTDPAPFCIPIWACYITAYARMRLYGYLETCSPIYCDTDSVITEDTIPTSERMGDMKLEMCVKNGFIIKPKMYALVDNDNQEYVKLKGVRKLNLYDFKALMIDPQITYKKFAKFKESVRRGFVPNEIFEITKKLTLEDNKRLWNEPFNPYVLQTGTPMNIIDGIPEDVYYSKAEAAMQEHDRAVAESFNRYAMSDLFDIASVGHDITPAEFHKNETQDI